MWIACSRTGEAMMTAGKHEMRYYSIIAEYINHFDSRMRT